MAKTCPECGSSNIVEDDLYSQKQLVCEDCGSVVSEGLLTTTLSDEAQATAVPYYISTEVTKRPCPNLIKGLRRVRALCRILRLRSDLESGAVNLFEQAYNHRDFLFVTLQKKEVLGGCCVLVVCRQNNRPVAFGTISALLEADPAFIGSVYQELTKSLNIEASSTGILDLLEGYCYGYRLGPGQVAEVLSEPPEKLVERTAALVELASDTWLVTGRHPLPILMASLYVAWQSMNPQARVKYSLRKFCQIAKVSSGSAAPRNCTALRRVAELRDVLCKLGRELPWLRGAAVDPQNVAAHVDDILKHRCSLLLKAMRSHEEEIDVEERAPPAGGDTLDTEMHWGKRHLFVPPSARKSKRRRADAAEPNVTGDEEISDGEIEMYIRSNAEVSEYREAQEKLQKASK
ncbi:transcription factor IIIB 50 kDa subunit [Chanos chanos]|uniref:Transcription factor IIIB 50 kDa subunit n=1 Tax=Chanos chanos TaxID=29144 RepID=A0A6J2UZ75_CHACN|nr:transcription factor IIIB 50 kDa subunit [Chanos chanos]